MPSATPPKGAGRLQLLALTALATLAMAEANPAPAPVPTHVPGHYTGPHRYAAKLAKREPDFMGALANIGHDIASVAGEGADVATSLGAEGFQAATSVGHEAYTWGTSAGKVAYTAATSVGAVAWTAGTKVGAEAWEGGTSIGAKVGGVVTSEAVEGFEFATSLAQAPGPSPTNLDVPAAQGTDLPAVAPVKRGGVEAGEVMENPGVRAVETITVYTSAAKWESPSFTLVVLATGLAGALFFV
ncbi:hypothetical protein T439DRAFT_321046 [Meredithblackwellia eburnea MCA 4105]